MQISHAVTRFSGNKSLAEIQQALKDEIAYKRQQVINTEARDEKLWKRQGHALTKAYFRLNNATITGLDILKLLAEAIQQKKQSFFGCLRPSKVCWDKVLPKAIVREHFDGFFVALDELNRQGYLKRPWWAVAYSLTRAGKEALAKAEATP